MIVGNRVIKSFVDRIREKLGEIDFDRNLYLDEAANALTLGHHIDIAGDQNAVVEGFETHIHVKIRAGLNTDYGVAKRFGYNNVERELAHLARPMHQVVHRNGEWGGGEV